MFPLLPTNKLGPVLPLVGLTISLETETPGKIKPLLFKLSWTNAFAKVILKPLALLDNCDERDCKDEYVKLPP